MRAQQQIWDECRATEEPWTNTKKAKVSGHTVASFRRVEYGPLPEPPRDLGPDKDVEIDRCTFHRSAAILIPGQDDRKPMQINAMPSSGSSISCISSGLGEKLVDHFGGLQVTLSFVEGV